MPLIVSTSKLSENNKFRIKLTSGQIYENDFDNYTSIFSFGGIKVFGSCY
jgi:hypothetical protein